MRLAVVDGVVVVVVGQQAAAEDGWSECGKVEELEDRAPTGAFDKLLRLVGIIEEPPL